MDSKQFQEEMKKTVEGRNIILESLIRHEGVTGFFALDKVETIVKNAVKENKIEEEVSKDILKYINIAYNLLNNGDYNEKETPFKQAIEALIKEQKQAAKEESLSPIKNQEE